MKNLYIRPFAALVAGRSARSSLALVLAPLVLALVATACGPARSHDAAPQAEPPPRQLALPLGAGATIFGRLAADARCAATYAMTIGALLRRPGEVSPGDELRTAYDPADFEISLGIKADGALTHEFDVFPADQAGVDTVQAAYAAGRAQPMTLQAACAGGGVLLVDYIDLSPDPYNPAWLPQDFLTLAAPPTLAGEAGHVRAAYRTTLAAADAAAAPERLRVAVWDEEAFALASPWRQVGREALLAGELEVGSAAHRRLVFDAGPSFYVLRLDPR